LPIAVTTSGENSGPAEQAGITGLSFQADDSGINAKALRPSRTFVTSLQTMSIFVPRGEQLPIANH